MSDPVLIAIIVGLPPTIAAISALISSIRNRQLVTLSTAKVVEKIEKIDEKVEAVHQNINGKMTQLLETTGAKKLAEGEAIGREKAISEKADRVAEEERKEDRAADKQS